MEKTLNNYKYLKTIGYEDGDITSLAIFPSGDFLSVSKRGILFDWDKSFDLNNSYKFQGNDSYIISVIEENNFMSVSNSKICCFWRLIKIKEKKKKIESYYEMVLNNHNSEIFNCYSHPLGKLIFCSSDLISVWQKNDNNSSQLYYNLTNIKGNDISSFLFIKSKNYFVFGSNDNLSLWKFSNCSHFKTLTEVKVNVSTNLEEYDNDNIVAGYGKNIYIIDLKDFQIKKKKEFPDNIGGIAVLKDFIFVCYKLNMSVLKKSDLSIINDIEFASMTQEINGFKPLRENLLALYSKCGYIRLFSNQLLQ